MLIWRENRGTVGGISVTYVGKKRSMNSGREIKVSSFSFNLCVQMNRLAVIIYDGEFYSMWISTCGLLSNESRNLIQWIMLVNLWKKCIINSDSHVRSFNSMTF